MPRRQITACGWPFPERSTALSRDYPHGGNEKGKTLLDSLPRRAEKKFARVNADRLSPLEQESGRFRVSPARAARPKEHMASAGAAVST
jgi:hypothetical protein